MGGRIFVGSRKAEEGEERRGTGERGGRNSRQPTLDLCLCVALQHQTHQEGAAVGAVELGLGHDVLAGLWVLRVEMEIWRGEGWRRGGGGGGEE